MTIKQLSVFVENRRGKLFEITDALAAKNIDLRAVTVAETSEFGVLRLIASNPDDACKTLRDMGMIVRVCDVVAIGVSNKPGEFSKATRLIADVGVNIEYLYTLASPQKGEAVIIVRLDQPGEAISALKSGGFRIIEAEEIYS